MTNGDAEYQRQHQAVRRARGRASDHLCEHCGGVAIDWARKEGSSGSDPLNDYMPLCRGCHIRYDRGGKPGRRKTQDEKDRISAKLKGRPSPTAGMTFTDQTRAKMRASYKRSESRQALSAEAHWGENRRRAEESLLQDPMRTNTVIREETGCSMELLSKTRTRLESENRIPVFRRRGARS
jgi:hypothetical protein